jgi:hypothetical protein
MKVPLDRDLAIRLYCYVFQAERSIACGLGAPWQQLREYYSQARRVALDGLARNIAEKLASSGHRETGTTRDEVARETPGIFHVLLGRALNRWKRTFRFPGSFAEFLARTLKKLLQTLDSAPPPGQNDLIALRMDLCCCRSILEATCAGLAEISGARRLEHFWQAPWITPVRMGEIIPEPVRAGEMVKIPT